MYRGNSIDNIIWYICYSRVEVKKKKTNPRTERRYNPM